MRNRIKCFFGFHNKMDWASLDEMHEWGRYCPNCKTAWQREYWRVPLVYGGWFTEYKWKKVTE